MSRTPHRPTALASIALASLLVAPAVQAETEVAEFRGSMSRTTPEFEVTAPWILDWRVTTDGAYDAAVEVSLDSAGLGVHQGRVLLTKSPGNGVRLFRQGGRFQFRVDSSLANWTLRVVELTEEEAGAYTPKGESGNR